MPAQERNYIVIVRADPVRLRAVIEREGWQMPLAPFLASEEVECVLRILARPRRK